jgi:peptidoglycan L-alanyl-D-glutamate endopeptidase CwlK
MVAVVKRAIVLTDSDFTVFEGVRSARRQNRLFRKKASQLDGYHKISKHQKQSDGFGHAVDLVPWIDGQPRWEWEPIYDIADAMQIAAEELDVPIRWGGAWIKINGLNQSLRQAQADYVQRKLEEGKRAFPDGPHYELLPD